MTSPDIGLLFSPSDPEQPCSIEGRIPGTFSERLVFTDGRRSPDLRIVPRGDPETGGLVMAPELPLGAGNHGGLLPQEINAVLAVGGSAFPGSAVHDDPAGHADLAVTIMTLEGLLSGSDMVKPTAAFSTRRFPAVLSAGRLRARPSTSPSAPSTSELNDSHPEAAPTSPAPIASTTTAGRPSAVFPKAPARTTMTD